MSDDCIVLFHYALFAAQCPQMLRIFLAFHHIVFRKSGLLDKWRASVYEAWTMFNKCGAC